MSAACAREKVVTAAVCRHCARKLGRRRRRGLCPSCYADPEVRRSYPTDPIRGKKWTETATPHGDSLPTSALPHTEEYLDALAARAELHEPLFHPGDEAARVERWGHDWRERGDIIKPGANLLESWRQCWQSGRPTRCTRFRAEASA